MLKITNNEIYLTRGDTMQVELTLTNADGTAYEPAEGDEVIFRLRKNVNEGTVLIEKSIDTSTMVLELAPEDTIPLSSGTYHYEVEIITSQGHHYTVIEDTIFTIGRELEDHG